MSQLDASVLRFLSATELLANPLRLRIVAKLAGGRDAAKTLTRRDPERTTSIKQILRTVEQ